MRLTFFFFMVFCTVAFSEEVTYDHRSLIINGTRRILFSGSIHYPRSTPQMWPALIRKAQQGGIDVIQTYVFWNVHEPIEGQYNFEGRYDLVKFIKAVRDRGLYVSLRVGPFIESEWGYGGFPYWLREIEGIVFRSDNEKFKFYMKKYVTMICNMMKSEKLFASQGGPIILVQIENEYQMVEDAFHELGPRYVKWAASMAVSQKTGVPWMMCKQQDAPDPVINTCNGMKCGETFQGPNSPNKPSMWTENWTSFYQAYGEEKYIRSAEDIAFNVALFIIAKDGSFVNYYMYHGGTNFGRSASAYVITSYYDEAPIDEYGLIRQPKWGHLKELHAAIKASSNTILNGKHISYKIGQRQDAHVYQAADKCVAFLVNSDPNRYVTLRFWNFTYDLPRKSISILPDCRHVSFNTAMVRSPYSERSENAVNNFDGTNNVWEAFEDRVPKFDQISLKNNMLLDQMSMTKDKTDYLWYTASYNHEKDDDEYILHVQSKAHVIHAFVNDAFIGSSHGSLEEKSGPILIKPMALKKGLNTISLLSVMVGLPASGAYMEKKVAGLRFVKILKGSQVVADLRKYQWGYQVGLVGEELNATQLGMTNVEWKTVHSGLSQPLVWYKTTFDAPTSKHPLALNLGSMGKGEAWINGESIGRYWVSFKTVKGEPSQSMYHVPQSFLKPTQNALVLFEEIGGNPLEISLNSISVDKVCNKATDSDIPVSSFRLRCHEGKRISSIDFASYGSPLGDCGGSYSVGSCHSSESKSVVEKACVGRSRCYVPLSASVFGGDPCPGATKTLLAVANCS